MSLLYGCAKHTYLKQGSSVVLLRFFCSLALIGVLICGNSSQATESVTRGQSDLVERLQWIDVHVHLVGGRGERFHDYEGAVKEALRAMDETGIRMCIVMPPPQPPGYPPPYDYDRFISSVKPYPRHFAFLGGGGTLNPMIHGAERDGEVGKNVMHRFQKKANEIIRH